MSSGTGIEVCARIKQPSESSGRRHSNQLEGITLLSTGNRITDAHGSSSTEFQRIFNINDDTQTIFEHVCEPQVDLLVAGYNTSVIFYGTSDAGATSLAFGRLGNGLIGRTLDSIFHKLAEEESLANEDTPSAFGTHKEGHVSLQAYEITAERCKDLMNPRNRSELQVKLTAGKGYHVKEAKQTIVRNADAGKDMVDTAYGHVSQSVASTTGANHSTVFVRLEVIMNFRDAPQPHRSRITFVILPDVETFSSATDSNNLFKSIYQLDRVVMQLAQTTQANRVIDYKQSLVTKLLQDELGGNCSSKLVACFTLTARQQAQRDLLRFCRNATLVQNYPIPNDAFAQQLIIQYRAEILSLLTTQPSAKTAYEVAPDNTNLLELRMENVSLKDQVERLKIKVEQLQGQLGTTLGTKSELSTQLVDSEEEKLRATKSLLDVQILNNKLREELESSRYELTNRILQLEHELHLSEIDRKKSTKEAENLRKRLSEIERERRELADEYVNLKTSYMSLVDDHERQIGKNEELTMELLNLINAKAVLAKQKNSLKYASEAEALMREEERIRGVVNNLSTLSQTYTTSDNTWKTGDQRRENIERDLFNNERRFQDQISRLKTEYADNQLQLESRIESMKKETINSRSLARERQQKISFLNTKLITLTAENEELKTNNNRLQHKIKDINQEYKLRLNKYVEDIANYMDSKSSGDVEKDEESMAKYVNKMLKDIKSAHRAREEQLSQAAQSYRNRMDKVIRKHEELLCAYRDLRSQIESREIDNLDLGADEHELAMSDPDLQSSQQKEILRLQTELHSLRFAYKKHEGDQLVRSVDDIQRDTPPGILKNSDKHDRPFSDLNSWTEVRKQLKDFSQTSLKQLEEERAALMTKNIILEEQLNEAQQYIDKHLVRYKEEITKLRQQLRNAVAR